MHDHRHSLRFAVLAAATVSAFALPAFALSAVTSTQSNSTLDGGPGGDQSIADNESNASFTRVSYGGGGSFDTAVTDASGHADFGSLAVHAASSAVSTGYRPALNSSSGASWSDSFTILPDAAHPAGSIGYLTLSLDVVGDFTGSRDDPANSGFDATAASDLQLNTRAVAPIHLVASEEYRESAGSGLVESGGPLSLTATLVEFRYGTAIDIGASISAGAAMQIAPGSADHLTYAEQDSSDFRTSPWGGIEVFDVAGRLQSGLAQTSVSGFDYLAVALVAPEPATPQLLVIGLLACAAMRRWVCGQTSDS